MPKDKSGKFHGSIQRANAADKMKPPAGPKPEPALHAPEHDQAGGGVADHLSAMHAESGGKHMHVQENEMGGMTSHHVGHDGAVEGPHDHENLEALKSHMDRFFNEEQHEY